MASSDLREFVQTALLRYDPDIDLGEGSRADSEVVEPIIQRIGTDPFDEDIETFIRERIRQVFPNLAITEADELTDVLIDPMRVIIEPIVREVKLVNLRRSLRNIESLSDDEVDALMGNFFESRISGGYAIGVVRAYFSTPQSLSLSLVNPGSTRGGLRFLPTKPQQITADQMLLNVEGSEYYFDINYTAENRGEDYNVEAGEIVSIANLPTAVRVRNPRRFRGGTSRETSVGFAARIQSSVGEKTLTTSRGIASLVSDNFPDAKRIFSIGFGDPEMQRDVVKGGGLGPIPNPDVYGNFYGSGTAVDDIDADLDTPILNAPSGNFVSRLGAVGTVPDGWYVTLSYTDPLSVLVVVDVAVLEVLSNTQVRVDHALPVTSPATAVVWMLRQQKITLSDIPGGIVLPDTTDGSLELTSDSVHIGGKTDLYVAGGTEESTSQITSLTDESPLTRGGDAETQGSSVGNEDIVVLNDYVGGDVVAGMSLVLEEGVDAGSYRILEVIGGSPFELRVDTDMTGTQGTLLWRIVDEIDTELTDPKEIKIEGSDLVTAAGSQNVTTSGAVNFVDANVQVDDILELIDDEYGGDFTVQEVNAVSLVVTPAMPRTLGAAPYRVFRRSEAVAPPLVRVSSMELLDSSGAPSGTRIPYRDPVTSISNAFQNEGSGFLLDGLIVLGLVSSGVAAGVGTYAVGGGTLLWEVLDPDRLWDGTLHFGTFTFTAGSKTAAQILAEINANPGLDTAGVKAVVLTLEGQDYIGIVCVNHVRFYSGTALTAMGWQYGSSNAVMRPVDDDFTKSAIRIGDVFEVIDGPNAGLRARVVFGPYTNAVTTDEVFAGNGPIGPENAAGQTILYNAVVFNPAVSVRVRFGRPSVGSARTYFLDPTSAEFDYATTRFTTEGVAQTLEYRPDPENLRTLVPPPPLVELPNQATTTAPLSVSDSTVNFLLQGIKPGDLIDILYAPIIGTSALASSGDIAVGGLTLRLRLDADPYITVSFPFNMPRQDVVDYINEQIGEDIAVINGSGQLQLQSSKRIEIDPTSTSLAVLFISSFNTDHPDKGTYIIRVVGENLLTLSGATPLLVTPSQLLSSYRIRRYVQRFSSTEMNENLDASGMYYADVQMISMAPGDDYNVGANAVFEVTGHRSDGYRLTTDNTVTTFSRAEVLRAEISRTILLVGSSDSPEEYVQISKQNVQVTYDRSPLVDDVQSFSDSEFNRILNGEVLVKHLMPHYVSLSWNYVGGNSEADMKRAVEVLLDEIDPDEELEVTDLTDVLRRRGATSIYVTDASNSTGRAAPLFVVIHHDEKRRVRAQIVKDFVSTVRTQRYIPDNIALSRVSPGGIR